MRAIIDREIAASRLGEQVLGQLEFLAENAHLIVSADEQAKRWGKNERVDMVRDEVVFI